MKTYFKIFIILTKEILSNSLRISSEKYEFWEEKYFWLFILLLSKKLKIGCNLLINNYLNSINHNFNYINCYHRIIIY